MKQVTILFVAVFAMSLMASESQAQSGFSYGSYGGGRAFSLSVGNGGFYGPGYGYAAPAPYWGGGYYAPVPIYRPMPVPFYGGYGGGYGGYGGGCRHHHGW